MTLDDRTRQQWLRHGYRFVGVRPVGDADTCPACQLLATLYFDLADAPELPHPHCTSRLGCRCRYYPLDWQSVREARLAHFDPRQVARAAQRAQPEAPRSPSPLVVAQRQALEAWQQELLAGQPADAHSRRAKAERQSVANFFQFVRKPPDEVGERDVEAFVAYLHLHFSRDDRREQENHVLAFYQWLVDKRPRPPSWWRRLLRLKP